MMALHVYDILKQVRKGMKVNTKLTRVEAGAPHASDETMKQYSVVDHRQQQTKNMVFKINPDRAHRQITMIEQVPFKDVPNQGQNKIVENSPYAALKAGH